MEPGELTFGVGGGGEAQAIIDVMTDLGKVQRIEGLPEGHFAAAVPKGFELHDFTNEIDSRNDERATGPRRIEGAEGAETLESFIALVNRHGTANTAIFARGGETPRLEAVIDYHGPTSETDDVFGPVPAWRKQRVTYMFPFTNAFEAWKKGGLRGKNDFVLFVEDRIREIAEPEEVDAEEGSLTREVFNGVLRAQGKSKAERAERPLNCLFGSPSSLLNDAKKLKALSFQRIEETDHGLGGVEFKYEKADKVEGSERVREYYLVEVEVFKGEEAGQKRVIPARLKASANEGNLTLGLELLGVDRVIEAAFLEAVKRVFLDTDRPVYRAELAK
jgi:hypothetical protein